MIPDTPHDDDFWMREAIQEARLCLRSQSSPSPATTQVQSLPHTQPSALSPQPSDVPVGAICVYQGAIIGRGHNRREVDQDPTAHAEVLALQSASRYLKSWRLGGVTLYVTLEPCVMCAGAIWLARVERVVFGAPDERAGACGSLFDITRDPRLNHRPQLHGGVLAGECAALLQEFFINRRGSGNSVVR